MPLNLFVGIKSKDNLYISTGNSGLNTPGKYSIVDLIKLPLLCGTFACS